MSRRSAHATVEEVDSDEDVFDDDTDIPLPSRPFPSGRQEPLLQSLNEDDDYGQSAFRRGATSEINLGSGQASPSLLNQQHQVPTVSDLTPYKKWTCIYPISIDAKRALHAGERRIAFTDAIWWPLSKDMADASARLGLGTLHEVSKCHPRDWANPGRVRVQWKKENGGFVNPTIRTKKQLLVAIAAYIQAVKPELVPKPESMSKPESKSNASTSKSAAGTSSSSSAKATSSTKLKGKAAGKAPQTRPDSESPSDALAVIGAYTHAPPIPPPALAVRVSAYSPALPSGVLVDALKAAMNAGPEGAAGGGAGMGAGKGKRKVVRVRG
ncbi:signal recognition particle, SRP19 subunit [Schizopora paradoxa]|uniref:Signal recognition particle, SRP19 subunit n=1 Tax=Schizopora paradoxa TaxID=27342 RepID=A0A0H2RWA7_9AGAM|nr:signal recognition particle, SRP19 subunit [Schizopora paradoxa]